MKVDDDFQAILRGPCDRIEYVGKLALNVRFTRPYCERPIADGKAHMIEPVTSMGGALTEEDFCDPPSCRNISKVGLGDPRVPMLLKGGMGGVVRLVQTKGPFVNNVGVASIVKDAGSDPWLDVEDDVRE
jgi:hypothetical protein